jgi:hypothetical protein
VEVFGGQAQEKACERCSPIKYMRETSRLLVGGAVELCTSAGRGCALSAMAKGKAMTPAQEIGEFDRPLTDFRVIGYCRSWGSI